MHHSIPILLSVSLAISSCTNSLTDPTEPKKTATVTITDKKQTYYSSLNQYGLVEIYYNVKNTGNVKIDYYKVTFKVTCKDGSVYTAWDNGTEVNAEEEVSDKTYVDTADKQFSTIEVTKQELTHY